MVMQNQEQELIAIPIKDVRWDEDIYPRISYNWIKANEYAYAMKAGAKFPPIVVALHKNKYYGIDGRHRIEAHKTNKLEIISAVLVDMSSKKQMFIEAVKLNNTHGFALNFREKAKIIHRLQEFKMGSKEISMLVSMPMDKIEPFMAKRITHSTTGEVIFLKSSMKHMANQIVEEDFEQTQAHLASMPQLRLINYVIALFEDETLDLSNANVKSAVEKLQKIMKGVKI